MGKDELGRGKDADKELSWFKMTGWYNLRSTILLLEGLTIFIVAAYFNSFVAANPLNLGAFTALMVILVLSAWFLQSVMLRRFISKWVTLLVFMSAYITGCSFGQNYFIARVEYWGSTAKQYLHAIQVNLERYAADNEGHYPPYLIGGDNSSGDSIDPLVRGGYMDSYPRSAAMYDGYPFNRQTFSFIRSCFPWTLRTSYLYGLPGDIEWLQKEFQDPYGADSATSRFGKDYTLMGNVAADHRFSQASFGYPLWQRSTDYYDHFAVALQGQFLYKALYSPGASKPDAYVLMAFGPVGAGYIDILTSVPGGHELDCRLPDGSGIGNDVPALKQLGLKGDGLDDGVIIVLAGGWVLNEI